MRIIIIGVAALSLLAGCATNAGLTTDRLDGGLKAGGFAFADPVAAQPAGLQDLVARKLQQGGLTPAPAASADYLVYVGLSALPIKTGVYLPDAKAPQAPPTVWNVDPRNGKKLHLEVAVLERTSGKTVFDGSATLTGLARHDSSALPDLVQAAFGAGARH